MYTFTTQFCCQQDWLPESYIKQREIEDGDPYEPGMEVEDVDVEVEYTPGWEQAGCRSGHPDNWTPDEGENPEILRVTIMDEDGEATEHDILPSLPRNVTDKLESEAWEDQKQQAEDGFDEPDDYPDDDYDDRY